MINKLNFNSNLRKQIGRVIEENILNDIESIILKLSMIDSIKDVVIDNNKNNYVRYRFQLTFIDDSQSIYEIDNNGLIWKVLCE